MTRVPVQLKLLVLLTGSFVGLIQAKQTTDIAASGRITDPQSKPVADLRIQLIGPNEQSAPGQRRTDKNGHFEFHVASFGTYTLKVSAPGFQELTRNVVVTSHDPVTVDAQLGDLNSPQESITVTADLKEADVLFPDPAQRVFARSDTLDANPGRPGAPISIPGLPIETASGGIKAPQYFSPGIAGDHGEPIAEYVQVGTYLVSNNLSSNAHGNGYADPNIMVPAILAGVQTDGGAFNVREGNHAENLSAIYQLRSRLEPFVTVTGDYRDIDVVAGWSPEKPDIKSWIVIEAAYGNGFLDRLEHRRRDEIEFSNVDLLNPTNSYTTLVGFNSPKATLSFLPLDHPALPTIAFSFGEAFYTNDPRIGTGTMQGTTCQPRTLLPDGLE